MRNPVASQAIGVTAMLAAGLLGVIVNRTFDTQGPTSYLPPFICLAIALIALAHYFQRRDRFFVQTPIDQTGMEGWRRSGVVIAYLGLVIFGCGLWFLLSAFGRRPNLPPHEGVLGLWTAVLGIGLMLLSRFVVRGAI